VSTTAQALLAEAQELLDQRLDPLDHADFAERLADCPEALEEVIALRSLALLLKVPAPPVTPVSPVSLAPTRLPRQWWLAPLAAAAALFLMLNTGQEDLPPAIAEPELIVQAPQPTQPTQPVATPAVLHFKQSTESTTLSPPTTGDVLSLSITSRRTIRS